MATYEERRRLRLNDLRFEELDTYLDAASNIVDLADALHANTVIKSVRAHIHESFSGRPPSEVLVFFEALGSRPRLQQLFFGPHRYPQDALLKCQALSLSLIQASQLVTLELCGLQLSGTLSDFQTLGASLENHPSLKEFRLHDCSPEEQLQNSYAMDPLVRSLSSINSLERLVLNSTAKKQSLGKLKEDTVGLLCCCPNLNSMGLLGFEFTGQHFASMVSGYSSKECPIEELCIGTCKLGLLGDLSLAQILQCNKSLEYLDIQLEADESPVQIAKSLKVNNTLRHLFVHGKVSTTSQKEFAQTIRSNYTLKTLELMDGSVFSTEIHFCLRMSELVRELLIENASSSKASWMDVLISQRDDLDALFYLVSMNPLLCCS